MMITMMMMTMMMTTTMMIFFFSLVPGHLQDFTFIPVKPVIWSRKKHEMVHQTKRQLPKTNLTKGITRTGDRGQGHPPVPPLLEQGHLQQLTHPNGVWTSPRRLRIPPRGQDLGIHHCSPFTSRPKRPKLCLPYGSNNPKPCFLSRLVTHPAVISSVPCCYIKWGGKKLIYFCC